MEKETLTEHDIVCQDILKEGMPVSEIKILVVIKG